MDYNAAFFKIMKCIKSSKNELHLHTCSAMIAQYILMDCISGNSRELKDDSEVELKLALDKKAVELGLLTI